MAKQTGIGWTTLSVDDASAVAKAIKNDITDLDFATPRKDQDVTGIDKSAMERLLLLADFSINLNGVFNNAVGLSHDVFKTVPSTSVARTVLLVVGGSTLTNKTLFTDYSLKRSSNGDLTWKAPGVLSDGTVPTWT